MTSVQELLQDNSDSDDSDSSDYGTRYMDTQFVEEDGAPDIMDDDEEDVIAVEGNKQNDDPTDQSKDHQPVDKPKDQQSVHKLANERKLTNVVVNVANGEVSDEAHLTLSQRDWKKKFVKQNKSYKRCKIRYSDYCYIKPRTAIPAVGKPIIYVAEGAENWGGPPNLLCAGQVIKCDDKRDWVIIVVLWVGCLVRHRPDGSQNYSPQAKNMKVLVCPLAVFDAAEHRVPATVKSVERELRSVCIHVHFCFFLCLHSISFLFVLSTV